MKKIINSLIIILLISLTSCGFNNKLEEKHLYFTDKGEDELVLAGFNQGLPKNIVLPEKFMGKQIVEIGEEAFFGSNLKSVVIPASYKKIGAKAFFDSRNLSTVTFKGDSKLVEIGDSAFRENYSLKRITIPKSVELIGDFAFYETTDLTNVVFEENSKLKEIGSLAFSKANKLKTFTIPKSVNILGDSVFVDSSRLENIYVEENNGHYISVDGVLHNKNKTKLICYPNGKKEASYELLESVTSISKNAFYKNTNLEKIKLSNVLTTISDFVFTGSSKLTYLVIPKSVLNIGRDIVKDIENFKFFLEQTEIPKEWDSSWKAEDSIIYLKGTWKYNDNGIPVVK